MKIIYSIGAKFAGGGIGNTAYHAVAGLHRHKFLHRLFCDSYLPTEIPNNLIEPAGLFSRTLRKMAVYDRSHRINYWQSIFYDAWSASRLPRGRWFHVWNNYGLKSLAKAKAMGMITSVERASSHPLHQYQILKEEYARWNIPFHIPKTSLQRSIAELEQADYVLIPSDFVYQSFIKHNFAKNKLIQIPFGVDSNRFKPLDQPKAVQARTSEPFRVLFMGKIGVRKGVLYLLEAWKQLKLEHTELWLTGEVDKQSQAYLAQYRQLPGVKFLGYISDPVSIFQQADVFVFPTVEEGSALVTYEAMACGLPVITTPNAGSIVRDGIDGFINPVGEIEAISIQIEKLFRDELLRKEMGLKASIAAKNYSWHQYGNTFARRLSELVR